MGSFSSELKEHVPSGEACVSATWHARNDVELVIEPQELAGGRRAVIAATLRITEVLERFVRAHPEQGLWLHRRWKGGGLEASRGSGSRAKPLDTTESRSKR